MLSGCKTNARSGPMSDIRRVRPRACVPVLDLAKARRRRGRSVRRDLDAAGHRRPQQGARRRTGSPTCVTRAGPLPEVGHWRSIEESSKSVPAHSRGSRSRRVVGGQRRLSARLAEVDPGPVRSRPDCRDHRNHDEDDRCYGDSRVWHWRAGRAGRRPARPGTWRASRAVGADLGRGSAGQASVGEDAGDREGQHCGGEVGHGKLASRGVLRAHGRASSTMRM